MLNVPWDHSVTKLIDLCLKSGSKLVAAQRGAHRAFVSAGILAVNEIKPQHPEAQELANTISVLIDRLLEGFPA